jgi:hypothetical protein
LDLVIQPQVGEYLGGKSVLGLEGAFYFFARAKLQLHDLSDTLMPERPKVHKVADEGVGRLDVIPERHSFRIDESLEDARL